MKRFHFFVIIFILTGLVGCTRSETEPEQKLGQEDTLRKEIVSVKVKCIQSCIEMKDRPFLEKTFEEKATINEFTNAIYNAEKIDAAMDYSAVFLMELLYKDGASKQYHLNIYNIEGSPANLVELPGSQGYKIPEETCNALRKIIYKL